LEEMKRQALYAAVFLTLCVAVLALTQSSETENEKPLEAFARKAQAIGVEFALKPEGPFEPQQGPPGPGEISLKHVRWYMQGGRRKSAWVGPPGKNGDAVILLESHGGGEGSYSYVAST